MVPRPDSGGEVMWQQGRGQVSTADGEEEG